MKLARFSLLSVVVEEALDGTVAPRLSPRFKEDSTSGLWIWPASKLPPKRPRKGLRVLLSLRGIWGGGGSMAR